MGRCRRAVLLALIAIAGIAALIAYHEERARRASELEWTVAHMPLGISAVEAERLIGRTADRIASERGVVANSMMFLPVCNSLATSYGEPQAYDIRVWDRGTLKASVVTDAAGRVVARFTWGRPWRPSLSSRLRQLIQRLL